MNREELEDKISDIIENNSPDKYDRLDIGNEHIFELARDFKGIWPDGTDSQEARSYFTQWYSRWEDDIVDEYSDPIDYPLCWSMFIEAWDKVKSPTVHMDIIIQKAVERGQAPPGMCWCEIENRLLLASVCYELQLQVGDGNPFSFSGYQASEVLYGNRDKQKKAARVMEMLCKAKVLDCFDRGRRGNPGRSAQYFYIGTD